MCHLCCHLDYNVAEFFAVSSGSLQPQFASTTSQSQIFTSLVATESWASGLGEGAFVTYSFNGPWGESGTGDLGGAVNHLAVSDQVVVREILQLYSNVANLTFSEVNDGTDGQIAFRNEFIDGGVDGYAYFPGDGIGGNVTLDSELGLIEANSFSWYAAIHEVGHAVGLEHPFEGDDASAQKSGGIPVAELTSDYTVMAYNGDQSKVTGLQLYDIYALQQKYSANTNYNSGDNTYTFDATGAAQSYALWDGGGTDTINAENIATSVTIDLRDGDYLNEIGVEEFRIAFDAQIENAIGGANSDTVIGNEQNNVLYGGSNGDLVRGGMGEDILIAGVSTSDSTDGNDTLYGDLGSDILYGNAGNDTLIAGRFTTDTGDGNDTLYGGLGDDVLYGNSGNDLLVGASGSDRIYGGIGDDIIRITANNQTDTIYGFEGAGAAGGDVIQLFSNMNGTDIDSFADLMNFAVTDGTHSFFATGGGNGVLVLFNTLDDFSADDFSFI